MRAVTLLSAGRAAYGLVLLTAPAQVLRACAGAEPSAAGRRVARVLGARHIAQAALTARGGRRALQLGVTADGLHSASMLLLAAAAPQLRRAELADAVVAAGLAAAGVRCCPSAGT